MLVLAVGDGQKPQGQLSADSSGSLFGTAASGGAYNGGIVFELAQKSNRAWKETILHSFGGPHDGFAPAGNLLFDSSGSIYGVTTYNPFNDGYGFGKIFAPRPKPGRLMVGGTASQLHWLSEGWGESTCRISR